MHLYNTMEKKKEPLIPIIPGKLGIYVCGITVYDFSHIGHARSAIVFDILVRLLRYQGYDVTFIRNFTDIDDKIINRANKEGRSSKEVAEEFINAFHEDMDRLGVLNADIEPKATDYIPEMIECCQKLLEADKAYITASGDVYFRVRSFPDYGKLSGRTPDELRIGVRIVPSEEKEDPLDFVLWKAAKPGEPSWESPWGRGRPGWHIECSAMSEKCWPLPLDIHGGGIDLIFPHHENEIAQTESIVNKPLAKIWMHNGLVQVNSEKMSKSLGNFKIVRDILEVYLPETLRFFLLKKHYRSPIDFSFEGMNETERSQKRVYECIAEVDKALERKSWDSGGSSSSILAELDEQFSLFMSVLEDDCNTAAGLGHLFNIIHIVRRALDDKALYSTTDGKVVFEQFREIIRKVDILLGVFGQKPNSFLQDLKTIRIIRNKIDVNQVEELLSKRRQAREEKNFVQADEVRNTLASLGIEIRDTSEGQVWDIL